MNTIVAEQCIAVERSERTRKIRLEGRGHPELANAQMSNWSRLPHCKAEQFCHETWARAAFCHLLGFCFAPRIQDFSDKHFYVPDKPVQWPSLSPITGGSINTKIIGQQLGEVLRLAASIQQGTVTASLTLRKLGSYSR